MLQAAADWYDGFFEREWLDHIALDFPPETTQQQVDFLVDVLKPERGSRILDLACGHGRITLGLARKGYRLTGLDLSPRSLELARRAAEADGLEVDWVHADMREIPAGAEFDVVINLFTSFGYFEDEDENQRVLDGVTRALAPGGRFLIDTINLLSLTRRYQERLWMDREDGVIQLAEHRFDALDGRNVARWTFLRPDGTRGDLVHSVRTYTPHELAVMIERAGLEIEQAWGGFDGGELSFENPRSILLARKP
jgi:2-polyprenyl-3-methyl-5-hydroxy-6-metoxy-1,4-benzoquinol methylase